jgi:hypothetical protein
LDVDKMGHVSIEYPLSMTMLKTIQLDQKSGVRRFFIPLFFARN